MFLNDLLSFVHLFVYGCKGYFLNEAWFKDTDCAARKNWPRIDIGYFIGYKDDNIRRFSVFNSKAKRTSYVIVECHSVAGGQYCCSAKDAGLSWEAACCPGLKQLPWGRRMYRSTCCGPCSSPRCTRQRCVPRSRLIHYLRVAIIQLLLGAAN